MARRKTQRGIKRSEAPCSEENNQRKIEGTVRSIAADDYRELKGGFTLQRPRLTRSQDSRLPGQGRNCGSPAGFGAQGYTATDGSNETFSWMTTTRCSIGAVV